MPENQPRHDALPLSSRAREYLARAGHPDNADTPERIADLFIGAGLPCFPKVIDTFHHFGGYVLPMGAEGRFKVHRARQAIRMTRFEDGGIDDPDRFRIEIGNSETIQASFRLDGHGRILEDDRLIFDGMIAWIEHWAGQRSR